MCSASPIRLQCVIFVFPEMCLYNRPPCFSAGLVRQFSALMPRITKTPISGLAAVLFNCTLAVKIATAAPRPPLEDQSVKTYQTTYGEIEVSIEPERDEIMLAEPTSFVFRIKNLSDQKLFVIRGGDYRNEYGRP